MVDYKPRRQSYLWDTVMDLRAESSGNVKGRILGEVFEDCQGQDLEIVFNLLARNPLPEPDMNMGVGKKTFRKAAARAFNMQYDDIREKEKELGELTLAVQELEPNEGLVGGNVEQVDMNLTTLQTEIEKIPDAHSEEWKIEHMADMLERSEYPGAVCFAVLADMACGVSSKSMRKMLTKKSVHNREMLDRAWSISGGNIGEIVRQVKDPEMGIRDEPLPFDRIKPQLASSASLPQNTEDWVGQYKYDGARILIHVITGSEPGTGTVDVSQEVRAFSRRGREITDNIPELQEIEWPHTDLILDAEAIGVDPETGNHLSYQKTMTRFQREKGIEEQRKEVGIEFKVFDILRRGSQDLTRQPFAVRDQELQVLFQEDSELLCPLYPDLEEAYANALDEGHEGIIAKDREASYVFKRDRSWRKKKPVKEPIDLRITDVIEGTGKMTNMLGALRLETKDGIGVGKVGTGFTDQDRKDLWTTHQRGSLRGTIVEIEFEELQKNGNKHGVRFPRFSRLRQGDAEADTLERIQGL